MPGSFAFKCRRARVRASRSYSPPATRERAPEGSLRLSRVAGHEPLSKRHRYRGTGVIQHTTCTRQPRRKHGSCNHDMPLPVHATPSRALALEDTRCVRARLTSDVQNWRGDIKRPPTCCMRGQLKPHDCRANWMSLHSRSRRALVADVLRLLPRSPPPFRCAWWTHTRVRTHLHARAFVRAHSRRHPNARSHPDRHTRIHSTQPRVHAHCAEPRTTRRPGRVASAPFLPGECGDTN